MAIDLPASTLIEYKYIYAPDSLNSESIRWELKPQESSHDCVIFGESRSTALSLSINQNLVDKWAERRSLIVNCSEASKPQLIGFAENFKVRFFNIQTNKEFTKFDLSPHPLKLKCDDCKAFSFNSDPHEQETGFIHLKEIPNTNLVLIVRSHKQQQSAAFEVRDISKKGGKLVYSSREFIQGNLLEISSLNSFRLSRCRSLL